MRLSSPYRPPPPCSTQAHLVPRLALTGVVKRAHLCKASLYLLTLLPMDHWAAERSSGHAIMMVCCVRGKDDSNETQWKTTRCRAAKPRDLTKSRCPYSRVARTLQTFSRAGPLHQDNYTLQRKKFVLKKMKTMCLPNKFTNHEELFLVREKDQTQRTILVSQSCS